MKHYFVKLTLIIGEYEKISNLIIEAPDRVSAGRFAMICEAHGEAEFDGDRPDTCLWDLGGEFAYKVNGIEEIKDDDLEVLKKYMHTHTYDEEFIEEMTS